MSEADTERMLDWQSQQPYMTTNHDELLAEIDRLDRVLIDSHGISALRAVVELHNEEKRYYLDADGEASWDSVEDVIAYYGDDEVTAEQVISFPVCAECARLEINLAKLGDYDYAYESSHFPCPTIQAIEKELK